GGGGGGRGGARRGGPPGGGDAPRRDRSATRGLPTGCRDRAVEPRRQRSGVAPHAPAPAGLRRRRQPGAAEGARARDARADQDGRPLHAPAHLRRVLKAGAVLTTQAAGLHRGGVSGMIRPARNVPATFSVYITEPYEK